MNDTGDWTHNSDDLLAKLVDSKRVLRAGSIVVARYPNHHSVIWYAGLRAPIDASEEALDRLVADGFVVWDESPRPLRRLHITPAGLHHARSTNHLQLAGD